jgi:aldose 1-epimerase
MSEQAPGRGSDLVTRSRANSSWTVDPLDGGRLVSLVVDGHELIAQRGDVQLAPPSEHFSYGVFPMAPWAGRIRDGVLDADGKTYQLPRHGQPHAMHGTRYAAPWDVGYVDDDTVALHTDLGPEWPFEGAASLEWRSTDGALHLRLSVVARQRMPLWLGVHPWFVREVDGHQVALDIDADRMYARGPDGLPTGELVAVPPGPWDDCFTGVTRARLSWGERTLTVTASTQTWVVFDERPEAVCAEPQTAPPDAARLGLAQWLEPGGELVLDVEFRWS